MLLGMRSRLLSSVVLPTWSVDFLTSSSLPSELTFSRAGQAMVTDSTGKLTYAPNNILLNTATLSTQNVTTVAGNYILSIKGTGSVTLSGTSTAGPLNGTGASNRVDLAFTPTAGTLTLTVSGSVTEARLSQVTYETSFRTVDDVDTTAAAYYGPRFDHDSAGNPLGLLIEASRANTAQQGSAWFTAGASVPSSNNSSPDGLNTAINVSFSAGAANYYYQQTQSLTSGQSRTLSCWVKSNTGGTQKIRFLARPDGSNDDASPDITVTTSWQRVSYTFVATATTSGTAFGLKNASDSSASDILVWGFQDEEGTYATSLIPTGTASVTRAAETIADTSPLTAYLAAGRSIFELGYVDGSATDRTDYAAAGWSWQSDVWYRSFAVYDNTVDATYTGAHLTVGGSY